MNIINGVDVVTVQTEVVFIGPPGILFILLRETYIQNKRIAELQQTAGPLKLGISKIEMAVSRSTIFGSPIWFIYTFFTAKGNINAKYRSRMYSILDTVRKSNIKISIPHNSKKGVFFYKKMFVTFKLQLISLYAKNQISISFGLSIITCSSYREYIE